MSSLIITVISIALVAVTALMGAYYGGAAYTSYIATSRANTLISQTRQVMLADTQYMLDKGFTNFDSFSDEAPVNAGGYTIGGPTPILNLNTSQFADVAVGCKSSAIVSTIDGASVRIMRAHSQFLGKNSVIYNMFGLTTVPPNCSNSVVASSIDFSSADAISHPLVQMCLKLNAAANLPASGLTYTSSGLPYVTALSYSSWNGKIDVIGDSIATNFCVLAQASAWGSGFPEIFLAVTN